jgi:hypothetical protein
LGDIPLIGWLFKYKTTQKTKTNLLVFLTPHIVTEADHLGRLSRDKLNDFTQKEKLYVEGELIVTFKSGVTEETAKEVIARQNAAIIKTVGENIYRIKLKEGMSLEEAANQFSALPEVQKTEPVNIIQMPRSEGELSRPSVPSSAASETSIKTDIQPTIVSPVPSSVAKEASSGRNVQSTAALPAEEKNRYGQTKELLTVAPPKFTKNGKYAIQIKAYPEAEKNDAMAFAKDLKKTQPDVYVEKVKIRKRGVWYRILKGQFASIEDASNYMKEKNILEKHPGSFVQLKSEGRTSKPKSE